MVGGLSLILICCWDERFMMNELKDEVEIWELRKTCLGFWIEFYLALKRVDNPVG